MPARPRRDFDPTKSDSEDETYGVSPSKRPQTKLPRSRTTKSARKRRRTDYDGGASSEDDAISESEISIVEYSEDSEEGEVEIGATGRPKRKAARKSQQYAEEDTDEIEDDSEPEIRKPANKRPRQQEKWVTLRTTPGKSSASAEQPKRSLRNRSGSAAASRPTSSGAEMEPRRSGRRSHGNVEPDQSLGAGPSEAQKRPTRGGKGPKKGIYQAEEVEDEDLPEQGRDLHSTDELQRDHYRLEIAESRENLAEEPDLLDEPEIDIPASGTSVVRHEETVRDTTEIPESVAGNDDAEDDEEDDGPVSRYGRATRQQGRRRSELAEENDKFLKGENTVLGKRKTRSAQRSQIQESSDFEPPNDGAEEEEEDVSDSDKAQSRHTSSQDDADYGRAQKRRRPNTRSRRVSDDSDDVDEHQELMEEIGELKSKRSKRSRNLEILMENNRSRARRARQTNVNYDIMASNSALARAIEEEEEAPVDSTPSKRARTTGYAGRSLFNTRGPFGGAGMPPVLGGPEGLGAVGGADSDSSDDETMQRPVRVGTGIGGMAGMTPTTAHPGGLGMFGPGGGLFGNEATAQGASGTPANLGKVKDKQALADADPLGVDQNVNFDSVGGLASHINQLKEMVMLPLLYPEVFLRFKITPPRGVLFHGPPGTGKTLLARALASSVSSQGKKVTFYMRKGADALSKWVGEAERQLRLLFEEARKNQPSIIFFDEIDGLAPVRSSKQEQIHASIVSTLLATMDGMDGRGQVIVIGATNRPDSVDPALRRPGRFDREFYFPLPNTEARRAILDIHTKNWLPALKDDFKDEIAKATKGYGGADLRALCTEAALNAVQRRYPQIYKSNEKLQIRPELITVTAKDFMISVKKMVPSSERSASSGAAPLPLGIAPLLREPLEDLKKLASEVLPVKKALTALEEAEFEDVQDDQGMAAERMLQEFDRSRIFRPRLLVKGAPGMGQQYLAAALLHHFETFHVQAFDLASLLSDSTRSLEAAIIQLFTEVKRHKPSVIYIPNLNTWYNTVGSTVISTFVGLLRTLPPTDPVLLLGIVEDDAEEDEKRLAPLFGHSRRSKYEVPRPNTASRHEFFHPLKDYIEKPPTEFPDPETRVARVLEVLPPAPPEAPKEIPPPTKAELKAQKKKDRLLLAQLKLTIQPVMDQVKKQHRKYRLAVIDEKDIHYLFEEDDPGVVTSDLPEIERAHGSRPYEKDEDENGEPGLRDTRTQKFFYNLDFATVDTRLSNGYYKRPKDFYRDIKKFLKDARAIGDEERERKMGELLANVEVDMGKIEQFDPMFVAELENVYQREVKREKEMIEKARQHAAEEGRKINGIASNVPPQNTMDTTTDASSGPIKLGQLPNGFPIRRLSPSEPSSSANHLSDLSNLDGQVESTVTSFPSNGDEDTSMTNGDDRSPEKESRSGSSFGPSAQTRPWDSHTGPPTTLEQRKAAYNGLSQVSAITPMAAGSQPADYTNDASTTTSAEKNTGSSGDKQWSQSLIGTQSQSVKGGPDFSMFHDATETNSQLPDTAPNTQASQSSQDGAGSHPSNQSSGQTSSQQGQRPSQPPAVPTFSQERAKAGSLKHLLNTGPEPEYIRAAPTGLPPLVIQRDYNIAFFGKVVTDTSGCSVEQLEQLYSAMMNEIWRHRHDYDRFKVVKAVEARFDEELTDIKNGPGMGPSSQPD